MNLMFHICRVYSTSTEFQLLYWIPGTCYSPMLVGKTCHTEREKPLKIRPHCSVAEEPGDREWNGSLDEEKNGKIHRETETLCVTWLVYTRERLFLNHLHEWGLWGVHTHTHTHANTCTHTQCHIGTVYWIKQDISIDQSLCHLPAA